MQIATLKKYPSAKNISSVMVMCELSLSQIIVIVWYYIIAIISSGLERLLYKIYYTL